ncbi:Putative acetyltransferase OS=Streptomyces glaucescens OX=1907 GN=SGLAU_31245 PE=4 SV=1 [Streptomyces glaucescens]
MCRRLGFRHVRDVTGEGGTVTRLLVIPTTALPGSGDGTETAQAVG